MAGGTLTELLQLVFDQQVRIARLEEERARLQAENADLARRLTDAPDEPGATAPAAS